MFLLFHSIQLNFSISCFLALTQSYVHYLLVQFPDIFRFKHQSTTNKRIWVSTVITKGLPYSSISIVQCSPIAKPACKDLRAYQHSFLWSTTIFSVILLHDHTFSPLPPFVRQSPTCSYSVITLQLCRCQNNMTDFAHQHWHLSLFVIHVLLSVLVLIFQFEAICRNPL